MYTKSTVSKASMQTLCYVDINGSGEFFQSGVQCKGTRAMFFLNSMIMEMWNYKLLETIFILVYRRLICEMR